MTIPAPRWGCDDGIGVVFYQGRCPWLFSHAPSGRPAAPRPELVAFASPSAAAAVVAAGNRNGRTYWRVEGTN